MVHHKIISLCLSSSKRRSASILLQLQGGTKYYPSIICSTLTKPPFMWWIIACVCSINWKEGMEIIAVCYVSKSSIGKSMHAGTFKFTTTHHLITTIIIVAPLTIHNERHHQCVGVVVCYHHQRVFQAVTVFLQFVIQIIVFRPG